MREPLRKARYALLALATLVLWGLFSSFVSAEIIRDREGNPLPWNRSSQAYRPNPILFLHGFGSGDTRRTWREKDVDESLQSYFANYFMELDERGDPILALPSTDAYPQSRYPYLELLSFIDFTQPPRSQLIDRNSSVDTYQEGDAYVRSWERSALIQFTGWRRGGVIREG